MIGDVKTALDHFFTHFLIRALDRQSVQKTFQLCYARDTRRHATTHVQETRRYARQKDAPPAHDKNRHRAHMKKTQAREHDNSKKVENELIAWEVIAAVVTARGGW